MSIKTEPAPDPSTPVTASEPDDAGDDDADEPTFQEHDDDEESVPSAKIARSTEFDDDAPVGRRNRTINPRTRELFKAAAAKLKEQIADGEGADAYEPAIDFEEGDDADAPPPAAPGAIAAAVAGKPATPPAPDAAPPVATGPDPRTIAEWEKINIARAQLAAEEKRIAALHEQNAGRSNPDRYFEDMSAWAIDMIKQATGITDEEALTDEVGDLITELSSKRLGLALSPDVRSRLDSRRALKTVKAHKAQLAKQQQELDRRSETATQTQAQREAETSLGKEIENSAATYPFLAVEETAGEIVFDVCKRHKEITGEVLDWKEAARRANDYLKEKTSAHYAKRRHLLTEAPADKPATPPPEPSAQQGDPSSIRRSRTLRNGHASAPVGSTPAEREGRFDNEAHRKRSLATFRQGLKPAE